MTCYLDNNATTPVAPEVLEAMLPFLREHHANPSSASSAGARVREAIETAREQVAALVGCQPSDIVFTSCGTESNNTAIWSALQTDPDRQHVVTTAVEHSAIVKHCEYLATRGVEITWLRVDSLGAVDPDAFARALRPDTAIASVMFANNETGVLSPIAQLAEIAADRGVPFHTDAVQAAGKVPMTLSEMPVSAASFSGHKLHCPKGIGALYLRRRTRYTPWLRGGGQENSRRAGTENVASIVAFGRAAELAHAALAEENARVRAMRDRFERAILETVPDVVLNGDPALRLPNTSNLSFEHVDSEGALILLDRHGIACSAGSACTTGSVAPSHVLTAMGCSAERARGSLRFSFSRYNTDEEVDYALAKIPAAIERLRALRPKAGPSPTARSADYAKVAARAE